MCIGQIEPVCRFESGKGIFARDELIRRGEPNIAPAIDIVGQILEGLDPRCFVERRRDRDRPRVVRRSRLEPDDVVLLQIELGHLFIRRLGVIPYIEVCLVEEERPIACVLGIDVDLAVDDRLPDDICRPGLRTVLHLDSFVLQEEDDHLGKERPFRIDLRPDDDRSLCLFLRSGRLLRAPREPDDDDRDRESYDADEALHFATSNGCWHRDFARYTGRITRLPDPRRIGAPVVPYLSRKTIYVNRVETQDTPGGTNLPSVRLVYSRAKERGSDRFVME